MMNKISIIYTTFLRDELKEKTISSIFKHWNDDYYFIGGDQGTYREETCYFYKDNRGEMNYLPYDCGLSFARNELVQKAHSRGIPYCLITADSIDFTDRYNFDSIIRFIEHKKNNCLVGFNLDNRQPFEYNMAVDRKKGKFILTKPCSGGEVFNSINFQRCDIIKNFFLAPTSLLIKSPWVNELKICEHETFFNDFKNKGFEVFYTGAISANYINEKPKKYNEYRERLYGEFRDKMLEINNLPKPKDGCWLDYERY